MPGGRTSGKGDRFMDTKFRYISRYQEAEAKAEDKATVASSGKERNSAPEGKQASSEGLFRPNLRTSPTGENFARVYADTYGTNSVKVLWFKMKDQKDRENDMQAIANDLAESLNGQTYSYLNDGIFEKYKLVVIDKRYDSKNDSIGLVVGKQYVGRDIRKTAGVATAAAVLGTAGKIATGYNATKPSSQIL